MRNCYLRKVQLIPTDFELYILIGNAVIAENFMIDTFGLPPGWQEFNLEGAVAHTWSIWSEKLEQRVFAIHAPDFSPQDIAHEAVHVTWELARNTNFKYDKDNQEQQAYYVDWILSSALEMKGKKELIVKNNVINK